MTTQRDAASPLVVPEVLTAAELIPVGRIEPASNVAVLVRLGHDGPLAIHKPVAGETPLWDFPDGTLAQREVAAYLISEAGGWHAVPPTVLREGPWGPGSTQLWTDPDQVGLESVVDVVDATMTLPNAWVESFTGVGPDDEPVSVIHQDRDDVAQLAVLDIIMNNSDRKGRHLGRDGSGRLWGFDHGVCFHTEDKLRTVLWGFIGREFSPRQLDSVFRLKQQLDAATGELRARLAECLTSGEVEALTERADALLANPVFPEPSGNWPPIPWPAV